MCFWLKMLRVRGSWNTRVNSCIMTISVFFRYFEKIAHMSVVWAYVSLWLCMFGCLLQGPIRLKVYELMRKNQSDFGI